MLGLFIVVTLVEQRLFVLPNTAGKKELYGSSTCLVLYPIYIVKYKSVKCNCCNAPII